MLTCLVSYFNLFSEQCSLPKLPLKCQFQTNDCCAPCGWRWGWPAMERVAGCEIIFVLFQLKEAGWSKFCFVSGLHPVVGEGAGRPPHVHSCCRSWRPPYRCQFIACQPYLSIHPFSNTHLFIHPSIHIHPFHRAARSEPVPLSLLHLGQVL